MSPDVLKWSFNYDPPCSENGNRVLVNSKHILVTMASVIQCFCMSLLVF